MIGKRLLAIFALIATPAMAQQGADPATEDRLGNWPERVSAADASLADLQGMAAHFPHSGLMHLRVAQAAIGQERHDIARAEIWRYIGRGGVLSERASAFLQPYFDDSNWALLRARMAANAAPLRNGEDVASVGEEHGLIEGIAYVTDDILVSSVTERSVLARAAHDWEPYGRMSLIAGEQGNWRGSLMGMAYDADRGWLWVASSIVDQTPDPDNAFSGMIGIGPGRNEVLRLPVSREDQPGDVALGRDGSAYLAASGTGAVYVRRVGSVEFEQLLAPGRLRSAQGMAVSPDGSGLIISDYSYGLARLDLETGALDLVDYDGPAMIDGIDGLVRHENSLIAIRNGVQPNAILQIDIDADGRRITGVTVLERLVSDVGEPTVGTVADDVFYYISDARWADFGEGGALNDGATPRPTTVRRLPLR